MISTVRIIDWNTGEIILDVGDDYRMDHIVALYWLVSTPPNDPYFNDDYNLARKTLLDVVDHMMQVQPEYTTNIISSLLFQGY